MNVVKILLILGLGYFALTQKSEKTKNMLLVVTGLLAFCMFSLEGFTITSDRVPATCTEKASESVQADADACVAESENGEQACNAVMTEADDAVAACNYTPEIPPYEATEVGPTHLPMLFPSCIGGKVVKSTVPASIGEGLCEDAEPSIESLTWATICGENAECNASVGLFGGEPVAPDDSNKCAESLYGSWPHTCSCTDEGTWTPDTGSGNGCSEPS